MAIRIPELASQIGLEELADIGREEIAADFMPAAVTGLADGDVILMHSPYKGRQADLYGEAHYGEGRVARAISRAALENGMNPGPIYDFQSFAAQYFTDPTSIFKDFTAQSTVRVRSDSLVIDGNHLELPRRPALVFNYGACLTSRSYIDDQMAFLDQRQRPFAFSPLTRLHFTNQVLIGTYDAKYGEGTSGMFMDNRLYIGREDGVAAATDEVIRAQIEHNAPVDVADVILCAGVQHSTEEDLRQGVINAYELLRDGGKLVIRALTRPAEGEMGADEIAGWAFDAGFEEGNVVRFDANLNSLGGLLLTGHFGEREIKTLVLSK